MEVHDGQRLEVDERIQRQHRMIYVLGISFAVSAGDPNFHRAARIYQAMYQRDPYPPRANLPSKYFL